MKKKEPNPAASALAKRRWEKTTKEDRVKEMKRIASFPRRKKPYLLPLVDALR